MALPRTTVCGAQVAPKRLTTGAVSRCPAALRAAYRAGASFWTQFAQFELAAPRRSGGQRLTAGSRLERRVWALYGATPPNAGAKRRRHRSG